MSVSFLQIYHTNDIHSHFGKWGEIVSFIRTRKARHIASGEDVIVVDVGDFVDRCHVIAEATYGKGNVDMMNELYDYATIGNNEGLTLSKDELDKLYNKAKFDVVVGNVFDNRGVRPNFAKSYVIHTLDNGMKVGLLGMTVAYPAFYSPIGWDVREPMDMIAEILLELEEQVDVIVLLSHLGKFIDYKIAEQFPQIDVILGSHTHHLFEHGEMSNGVLLCCAEKHGNYVGQVTLAIDSETGKVLDKTATTIETSSLQETSREVERQLYELEQMSHVLLCEELTTLQYSLPTDLYEPSLLTTMLAIGVKEWCEAEIGMVNAGLILESLPVGIVTRGDIHRICPHPINPCRIKLTGREIENTVKKASLPEVIHQEVKGFGFRGTYMGRMVYDGLTIVGDSIFINGEPLQLDRTYIVGTIDMFTFGKFYPEIRDAEDKEFYMSKFIRDILAWRLSCM